MREQLVSFEIAQLARDKGFFHMEANCYGDNMCYQLPEGELINALRGSTISGYILAPTLSLLQKWLREVYGIYITPKPSYTDNSDYKEKFFYEISYKSKLFLEEGEYHSNYEEALVAGLLEGLKLINNE